jgi:hypothetical protein
MRLLTKIFLIAMIVAAAVSELLFGRSVRNPNPALLSRALLLPQAVSKPGRFESPHSS